jgi:hypothetical protein
MKGIDRLIVGALFTAVCCFLPGPVVAHDHGQADKYKSAKNKNGAMCCDGSDHDPVLDWKRTEKGFRVQLVDRQWVEASPATEVPNVHGVWEARVWLFQDDQGGKHIRCFLPGVEI